MMGVRVICGITGRPLLPSLTLTPIIHPRLQDKMFSAFVNDNCALEIEKYLSVREMTSIMLCNKAHNNYAGEMFHRRFSTRVNLSGLVTLKCFAHQANSCRKLLAFDENVTAMLKRECLVCKKRASVSQYGIVAHLKCLKPHEVRMSMCTTGVPPSAFALDVFNNLVYRTNSEGVKFCLKDGISSVIPSIYCLKKNTESNLESIQSVKDEISRRKKELRVTRSNKLKVLSKKRKFLEKELSTMANLSPVAWRKTVPSTFSKKLFVWDSAESCSSSLALIRAQVPSISKKVFEALDTYCSESPLTFQHVQVLVQFLCERNEAYEAQDKERLVEAISKFSRYARHNDFTIQTRSFVFVIALVSSMY